MKILIAIDSSRYSKAAIEEVRIRPMPALSQIMILTVVEPIYPEYASFHANYGQLTTEAYSEMIKSAQMLVDEACELLTPVFGKDSVTPQVAEGFVKDQIIEIAKDWDADLIIVGSHGRTGLTRFLLGSVSEAIASHSHCSVEIVKIKHKILD